MNRHHVLVVKHDDRTIANVRRYFNSALWHYCEMGGHGVECIEARAEAEEAGER